MTVIDTSRAGPWVLREPDPTAAARLFCFPVSGMGATVYRRWPDRIGAVEICPVQLPGRENRMRDAAFEDMEELGAALATALEPLLDVPYAFFGHCLGGRIAYATALACMDRSLPAPRRIFASSCLAPHRGGRFGPFLPEMTDEEFLARLRQGCLDRGEPVPDDELLGISVKVLRKDVDLSCGYAPAGPDGRPLSVTTIGWRDDADVRPDQMGDWARYGGLRHVLLSGDEHSFRAAPQELLRILAAELAAEPAAEPAAPGERAMSPGERAVAPKMAPATLTALFARSAAGYPQRTALSEESAHRLSYAELDLRSACAAARLAAAGVGREDRVGIHMRRGVELFVAVLAVLRAGAVYVTVDDRYPEARRDLMLDAAEVRLTLTEHDWVTALSARHRPVAWTELAHGQEEDGLRTEAMPGDAACILFTSGSTGVPKGAVLEHAGVAGFAANPALPTLRPEDRVAQISNVSFDAVHFELWGALAAGAELVVMPSLVDLVRTDLRRELRRRRITAMLAPTMAVNHIAGEDPGAFNGLRVLHTGGDVVRVAACRSILASGFAGHMSNLYGPTEASTAATRFDIAQLPESATSVPIGRAIERVTVYLLDDRLRPVPSGQPGILHIGGRGVARGYLRDPLRTARYFLPDPFGTPGSTMYDTGDLVRDRGDGVLEYLGRVDDQVKVRGYRVEPGEVERQLLSLPGVRDIAVLAVGEGQDCRLVAFVTAEGDALTPQRIRAFAEGQLPDYQVPADILLVEEIPATTHGKRNREALLDQLASRERSRGSYQAPRTAHERYLSELWESLLGIERISATDDFLRLGGHSMLAFRIRRRIEQDLGVRMPLQEILENTVLAELACRISSLPTGTQGAAL